MVNAETAASRKFGINLVGAIPWGTHLCQFYESKQDLIDILVPYFAEGLRSNEFCMWVTSPPLGVDEAKEALKKAVPALNDYLRKSQIEIISYDDWYLLGGKFDCIRVLQGWVEKEENALKCGFEGLRLTGNTFWVERNLWQSFVDYEEAVNNVIGEHKMLALCTYCLDHCSGSDVLDVVRNHIGTLLKQGNKWSLVEDVLHRKKTEEALKAQEHTYSSLFSNMMDGFAYHQMIFGAAGKPVDYVFLEINESFELQTGLKRENILGKRVTEALPGIEKDPADWIGVYGKVASTCKSVKFENFNQALGKWFIVSAFCPEKGYFVATFEDITERRKNQEKIAQQALMIANANDAIIGYDLDQKVTFWNKAAEQLYGYTAEEAMGRASVELLKPAYVNVSRELLVNRLANDGRVETESTRYTKNGRTLNIDAHVILLRNEAGKPVGYVSVDRDTTERKKAEESLRKLNRHLRAISNSNQALMHAADESEFTQEVCNIIINDCGYSLVWVGFAEHDKAKSVRPVAFAGFDEEYINTLRVSWDEKSERGRGPTGTAIRTGKPYICKNMESDPNFKPWREQAANLGYTASLVLPLASFEGATFGALNIYSKETNPFSDEKVKLLTELANDFAYGIVMLRLRKERERTEETLREQASLIDLSPDAIIVRKLDGAINFWSKGAEKLYGWTKAEAVGRITHDLLKTQFPEPLIDIIETLKRSGKWSGELIHETKDRRKVVVQSYWLAKLDEQGELSEMLESNVDITDLKQMQNKLEEYASHLEELVQERTQQLKDSERLTAIGETAGMVGHDLRNPLQTVTGETYLAKTELKNLPDSPAKANLEENIQIIAEQISYMDKIVSDLQDFVRPVQIDKKPIDLKKILNATLADVNVPTNIESNMRIEKDLPAVSADGQLLKRVFFNLFTNAVQAMPTGGKLVVRAKKQKAVDGNGKVIIEVQDTGEGIPDNVRNKIFKPLFTTKSKGQGFGLAVCRRVIEAHGGTITFRTKEGEGTKFIVELPI